ncbi:pentapeptide repeat protein [Aneurinibacillus soli]|uniref:Pentapeptide repeats (8 copies) n=1 Tax=Aneurinibacillus soli TaxID=1500254 RepID=A0A0U5B8Y9_9BACL|nr:pentapeptide repeat-containing protein [Aneurinibacillus soli]PYE60387.1 pentapeptide repeat protein [Aneurinibacillus soli]BAU27213.1 Pentapeptide repeats (8 copies) [Aneurinibacillus soli]
MKKEEALQHFRENHVHPTFHATIVALEQYAQTHRDELVQDFLPSFQQLCRTIKQKQAAGEKGEIGYITYSMLRTEILEGRHRYLVEATDNRWFLDDHVCKAEYDASWAFRFLDEFERSLEQARKVYMDVITPADLETIKLQEALNYHQYVIRFIRYAMLQAITLPEYIEIEKAEEIEIRVGEYFDRSEIVYKEDTREKEASEIAEWLEEKEPHVYSYEVFTQLDLSHGKYDGIDLRYANLMQSKLSHSALRTCILVGTNFESCQLEGVDMSYSVLYEASFRQSNLTGAILWDVQGAAGWLDDSIWTMPGFAGVTFAGANLTGTDFRGANLAGAIFTGAILSGTIFEGANLDQAVFSMKDREMIDLTNAQRELIIWES